MPTHIIVDTANLFNRCLHTSKADAYTKAGLAIHIMMRSIKSLYQKHNADHIIFATEHYSWRKAVYDQYKAHREVKKLLASPTEQEELEVATDVLNQFITFLQENTNVTVLNQYGIEGDDWMAGWINRHPDVNHIIYSGDTDFYCLLADNVIIYDGMNERYISTTGVYDDKARYEFTVSESKGKLKVGKAVHKSMSFEPEPNWWNKALFIKCIRGDSGDNIHSAYPRVRANKINQAWDGMKDETFEYINFMKQEVELSSGEKTTVKEAYEHNRMLIDLNAQPKEIKDIMNAAIDEAISREPVSQVGFKTIKWLKSQGLEAILAESKYHVEYLNKKYDRS